MLAEMATNTRKEERCFLRAIYVLYTHLMLGFVDRKGEKADCTFPTGAEESWVSGVLTDFCDTK